MCEMKRARCSAEMARQRLEKRWVLYGQHLSYRERRVLEMREEDRPHSEIAKVFKVRAERIRQIENQSRRKLEQLGVI